MYCPHCNGAAETAEHLIMQSLPYDQVQQQWPELQISSDPRRPQSNLGWWHPQPGIKQKTSLFGNCLLMEN